MKFSYFNVSHGIAHAHVYTIKAKYLLQDTYFLYINTQLLQSTLAYMLVQVMRFHYVIFIYWTLGRLNMLLALCNIQKTQILVYNNT